MKGIVIVFACMLVSVSGYAQTVDNPKDLKEPVVKIFPNPATDVVNILGLYDSAKANIAIFDSYGATVLVRQWPYRKECS